MRSKSATFKSMLQRRAQQTLLRPLARHGSSATFFGEYDMLPHTALVNAESKCIHAMRPYLNHAFRNDQLFITGKTNFIHLEKKGAMSKSQAIDILENQFKTKFSSEQRESFKMLSCVAKAVVGKQDKTKNPFDTKPAHGQTDGEFKTKFSSEQRESFKM